MKLMRWALPCNVMEWKIMYVMYIIYVLYVMYVMHTCLRHAAYSLDPCCDLPTHHDSVLAGT